MRPCCLQFVYCDTISADKDKSELINKHMQKNCYCVINGIHRLINEPLSNKIVMFIVIAESYLSEKCSKKTEDFFIKTWVFAYANRNISKTILIFSTVSKFTDATAQNYRKIFSTLKFTQIFEKQSITQKVFNKTVFVNNCLEKLSYTGRFFVNLNFLVQNPKFKKFRSFFWKIVFFRSCLEYLWLS